MNKEKKDDLDSLNLDKKIKKLRKDLESCEKQKEEYLNGWKRERADFLNYKKEEAEKLKRITECNIENLILKILPIIDNFDFACKIIPEKEKKENEFIKGFLQIKSYFEKILEDEGVKEINCIEEIFDPFCHEAIEVRDVGDESESGTVIEIIEKGYKIKDKLLRPAKVIVAK